MVTHPRIPRRSTLPYRIEHAYAPDRARCIRGLRLAFNVAPRPPFPDPPTPPTPPAARRKRPAHGAEREAA
jgi:hypothetical protein